MTPVSHPCAAFTRRSAGFRNANRLALFCLLAVSAAACTPLSSASVATEAEIPLSMRAEAAENQTAAWTFSEAQTLPPDWIRFLESAPDGAKQLLNSLDASRGSVTVIAENRYAAASGRSCRRYRIAMVDALDTNQVGVACITSKSWRPIRSIVATAITG
jgi:hypothetical protein